jgi:hypothetical protein
MRMETIQRELRGVGIALLLLAVTTIMAWTMVNYLGIRRGSVIYMLSVLLAGWRLGLIPALVSAVGVLQRGAALRARRSFAVPDRGPDREPPRHLDEAANRACPQA